MYLLEIGCIFSPIHERLKFMVNVGTYLQKYSSPMERLGYPQEPPQNIQIRSVAWIMKSNMNILCL